MLNVLEISMYLVLLMMVKQNAVQTAKTYSAGTAMAIGSGGTWPTAAADFQSHCTGKFPGVIGSDTDVASLKALGTALCGDPAANTYSGCALAIKATSPFGNWVTAYGPPSTYLATLTLQSAATAPSAKNYVTAASAKCLVIGMTTSALTITPVSDCTDPILLCQDSDESSTTTSTSTTTTTTAASTSSATTTGAGGAGGSATTSKKNGATETSFLACWIMFCVGRFYWVMV